MLGLNPCFTRSLSCGEPFCLSLLQVKPFLDEFREDERWGAIGEKMVQGVFQGAGDHRLGGDNERRHVHDNALAHMLLDGSLIPKGVPPALPGRQ